MVADWPPVGGEYHIGNIDHPVAIVIIGRGVVEVPEERHSIIGRLRTENLGIERIVANLISNPRIRFLIVCGREEFGHFPGDALLSVWRNGVDDAMRILGTRAAIPYLCNITKEAVNRFRDQVEAIDLLHPKEVNEIIDYDPKYHFEEERREELLDAIERCEARDPGVLELEGMEIDSAPLVDEIEGIGRRMNTLADQIVSQMLRMPSEAICTSASFVVVSKEFRLVADPVEGTLMTVPSIQLLNKLKSYLTGV